MMVSPVWSRLLLGHEHDTLHRTSLLVGSLVGIYSIFIVSLFFLDVLGFDHLFASQTAADLGVYAVAGSIVFVSALNTYTRGGLLASLAVGMAPSIVMGVLGLLFFISGGEQAGDLPLGAFVLLLLPALTLPLALVGFVLGHTARFVRVRVTG